MDKASTALGNGADFRAGDDGPEAAVPSFMLESPSSPPYSLPSSSPRSSQWLPPRRNAVLAIGTSFICYLALGCGTDASVVPRADAAAGDGSADNPTNPSGAGPAALELGSTSSPAAAGSYVLLAKTGVTNVTGSSITGGNLGVSPASASDITGFNLIGDPTTASATSASLVAPARIYASDYASPTPSNLTNAILAMQAAYTDAAARTRPDFLNLASGQLGGLTLLPGLYTWGSSVSIPSDVTIAGAANDVWIFQISNDLDVSSAKKVILAGGAQAKNIFWQVAGQATIHATAHFEGIILSQTGITLQTMATLHGRAFAQSLIAIDNSAVTAP